MMTDDKMTKDNVSETSAPAGFAADVSSEANAPAETSAPAGFDTDSDFPPKPFVFSRVEGIAALLTYPLAFLYTYVVTEFFFADNTPKLSGQILAAVFVLGFLLLTEYLHRDVPRPKESWFWLAGTLITAVTGITGIGEAWGDYNPLFLHCFAVYYALVRSGKLLDRTSGVYVFLDGWHAFIGWPFRYLFRKVRTAFRFLFGISAEETPKESENRIVRYLWALPALLIGGVLLFWAVGYLGEADDSFAALLEKFVLEWNWEKIGEILLRVVCSLPVGAYIYGTLDGAGQEDREHIGSQKARCGRILRAVEKVPSGLWIAILGVFTAVYVVFFMLQGQLLFSALLGKLPEGFTASSYARQGFFGLCKVMVINFALLWFVIYTSDKKVNDSRPLKYSLTLLMTESCLLAVTALAKLFLYISRFGFTPLRIQSSWLVVVLISGCFLVIINLWSGKKTFRFWLFMSCGLLALTQFL